MLHQCSLPTARSCSDPPQARTLGSARFAAAALLDGATRGVAGAAGFASEPPLWDAAGRRLALADALAAVVQARTNKSACHVATG